MAEIKNYKISLETGEPEHDPSLPIQYGMSYFRKYLDDIYGNGFMNQISLTELLIVQKIQEAQNEGQCSNIVKILNIGKDEEGYFYDQEKLELANQTLPEDIDKYKADIQKGIDQLHNICVIYIDLKLDNTGYSREDQVWKLFDFNFSGIVKKNQSGNPPCDYDTWERMPANGFKFKNGIKHIINNIDKKERDKYSIEHIINNIINNIDKKEWDKYSIEDWNQQIIKETNSRSSNFNSKNKKSRKKKSQKSTKKRSRKSRRKSYRRKSRRRKSRRRKSRRRKSRRRKSRKKK